VNNGVTTFYPFPHYEVQVAGGVTTTTKYYFFAGQRIAMQRRSESLTFLHSDHLNSTALATRGSVTSGQERYYAYGKDRLATATVPTDNRFTGQQEDDGGPERSYPIFTIGACNSITGSDSSAFTLCAGPERCSSRSGPAGVWLCSPIQRSSA
jgi:hypothetical protein